MPRQNFLFNIVGITALQAKPNIPQNAGKQQSMYLEQWCEKFQGRIDNKSWEKLQEKIKSFSKNPNIRFLYFTMKPFTNNNVGGKKIYLEKCTDGRWKWTHSLKIPKQNNNKTKQEPNTTKNQSKVRIIKKKQPNNSKTSIEVDNATFKIVTANQSYIQDIIQNIQNSEESINLSVNLTQEQVNKQKKWHKSYFTVKHENKTLLCRNTTNGLTIYGYVPENKVATLYR